MITLTDRAKAAIAKQTASAPRRYQIVIAGFG